MAAVPWELFGAVSEAHSQSAGHLKTAACLPSPVQQWQPQAMKTKLWDENLQSLGTSLFRSHLSVQELRLTPLGLSILAPWGVVKPFRSPLPSNIAVKVHVLDLNNHFAVYIIENHMQWRECREDYHSAVMEPGSLCNDAQGHARSS